MIKFRTGERKNIWLEVRDRDGLDFKISSAHLEILDVQGRVICKKQPATLDSNRILGLVDTNAKGCNPKNKYEVKFTFHIGAEIYIASAYIEITD